MKNQTTNHPLIGALIRRGFPVSGIKSPGRGLVEPASALPRRRAARLAAATPPPFVHIRPHPSGRRPRGLPGPPTGAARPARRTTTTRRTRKGLAGCAQRSLAVCPPAAVCPPPRGAPAHPGPFPRKTLTLIVNPWQRRSASRKRSAPWAGSGLGLGWISAAVRLLKHVRLSH